MKKRLSFMLMALCLTLLGQVNLLHAQSPRTLEIGPHAGVTTTINDINTWKFFSEPDLEYGGLVRYNHDSRWAFRADFTHSTVRATDSIAQWRPIRDLNFRSVINDFSLIVEFNFLDYYTGRVGKTVSPYLFGGASVFWYKTSPVITDERKSQLIGTDNSESISNFNTLWNSSLAKGTNFSFPFGFGCKVSLSEHLSASLELRLHYTLTDEIDGISSPYPLSTEHRIFVSQQQTDANGNPSVDANNNPIMNYDIVIGSTSSLDANYTDSYDLTDQTGIFLGGQQRGNSQSNDWFGSVSLSLTWKIPLPGGTACRIIDF